jgi:hypothetical protein
MRSWRAGCGGTRTSGSEGDGEETTGPKAGTGASPSTLRLRNSFSSCRTAGFSWMQELAISVSVASRGEPVWAITTASQLASHPLTTAAAPRQNSDVGDEPGASCFVRGGHTSGDAAVRCT